MPRFAGGEFVGYVGTATDIHERRSMEEALRESEASFRDLADTAPAMMWTTDEDGLVTFVNEGWLRFTGTSLDDELGASWQLGVHPEDAEAVLRTWDEDRARAPLLGARVPPASPLGRIPLDRRTAACRATREGATRDTWAPRSTSTSARRWRAGCSRSTSASTRSPRRSSAACCRSASRRSRAWSWPRATCPAPAGPRSAATGTTCSSAPTGAWRSWWGTWSATACARRRPWASFATPSGPTAWSSRRRRRWWRASTGS